ncbi:hypothetical protein DPMN_040774 [Dreissena polymorpha]|uniref:Uncharacterized protein n=1 Tax=Dreissena polymorpha TaxID=45954 RepID=A0A9D4HTD9_DREPO|nr:hypothetical protein DPMN_040774 [Dreissena polymorpha]
MTLELKRYWVIISLAGEISTDIGQTIRFSGEDSIQCINTRLRRQGDQKVK